MAGKKSDIVIVSNRLPVHRVRKGKSSSWETSPGGLVSALTPILRDRESTWIGWAGSSGTAPRPFTHDSIHNVPVRISKPELEAYYDGFSNATLWPLYHDAIRTPAYHREWWDPYVEVNRRFAEAAAKAVDPGGIVWVQDYHLQLAPAMIREIKPDVRVGFFLHIPFPPRELFAQLPWRREVLEGILGADVVGFQTAYGAENFCDLCRRYAGAGGRGGRLTYEGRTVQARAFPISIDHEKFERLSASEDVNRRAEQFRSRLGSRRRIILGVDRMDYTKGIDRRLRAFQELLRTERWTPADCVFVQLAVPSRERVEEYRTMRANIEALIGQINGEFGELGRTPVHYLHRSVPAEELAALYKSADVMVVTPFRDGMNLVAKEYIATRLDETGVLVLSEFTGAANELTQSLLINPHDINGLSRTLEEAMNMEPREQRRRMRALRKTVRSHSVYDWAQDFFGALGT